MSTLGLYYSTEACLDPNGCNFTSGKFPFSFCLWCKFSSFGQELRWNLSFCPDPMSDNGRFNIEACKFLATYTMLSSNSVISRKISWLHAEYFLANSNAIVVKLLSFITHGMKFNGRYENGHHRFWCVKLAGRVCTTCVCFHYARNKHYNVDCSKHRSSSL